jgi:membrane protein
MMLNGTKGCIEALLDRDPEVYGGIRRLLLKGTQLLVVSGKDFISDRCLLQASALSFTTILSLVPFLALAFALLKGFGVQNRLEPLLIQQLTAGSENAVVKIIQYINNTNMTTLGAAGLVSLVITVVSLFASTEEAFNGIWGVRETRSVYRKFTDYLSVAMVAPLLMLAATSMTTSLQSQDLVRWALAKPFLGELLLKGFRFAPYLSIWLALIFFYLFIPNTKVRFRSALVGGVLAGTIWQLAQWGYIHFQMGVTRYNAIYGTLALVPIIMVWIYTSWVIILFGGEVVWAHQTLRSCRRGLRLTPSHALHEFLTLSIFRLIAIRFIEGQPPQGVEAMAEELNLPTRTVQELVSFFTARGFLAEVAGEPTACLPAKEITTLSVSELLSVVRDFGGSGFSFAEAKESQSIVNLLHRLEESRGESLGGLTVRDLANVEIPACRRH